MIQLKLLILCKRKTIPAGSEGLGIDRVLSLSPTPQFIFRKGQLSL